VRDDGGDGAFRAGQDGTGLIFSAISRDPWRFDDIVLADRWDYSRLSIDRRSDNPEAALTDLVQGLSGPSGFDYDVAGYRVYGGTTYNFDDYYARGPIYVYDDYYLCSSWYWPYRSCRSWPYDGWSFGLGLGYYGYRPYGYGYSPYSPYYPYNPYGYGHSYPVGRRPVIAGRSRNYTVFPRPATGTGSHSLGGNVAAPPINWRPRSVARPVSGGRGPEVTRNSGGTSIFIPPARRARPGGDEFRGARGGGERNGGNFSGPARGEPRAYNPPEPRSYNPPERSRPSGGESRGGRPSGGDGGGGTHSSGNSGGGHSAPPAPSRSRRP